MHCYAGVSRSVATVVAYLMKKLGVSGADALAFVKGKRKQAYPNPGFLAQLQKYETYLSNGGVPQLATNYNAKNRISHSNLAKFGANVQPVDYFQGNKYGNTPIINITNNNNYNMNFDDPRIAKKLAMGAMR